MAMLRVASLDDPRLEPYRNLKASNATRHANLFVAEGDKLVERLLASDFALHSVLLAEPHVARFEPLLPPGLDTLVVPAAWVEQIVGFNFHRGVLACAKHKPSSSLVDICQAKQGRLTLVVCPDVQDPENLGAILRIGSAFGIDALVLGDLCADPFSRRVLRVSMGAAFQVPVVEARDLAGQLGAAREASGLQAWAAVTDADAAPFDAVQRPLRLALLLGSEGHGLAPHWIANCQQRITIPMRPGVDSLNVAVAAGILLQRLCSA